MRLAPYLLVITAIPLAMTWCSCTRYERAPTELAVHEPGASGQTAHLNKVPTESQTAGREFRVPFAAYVTGPLDVPFEIRYKGALAIGSRPQPLGEYSQGPVKDPSCLYLVLPSEIIIVSDLAQLPGRVTIRTPEEALSFCRLLTSPKTLDLWATPRGRWEAEIVSHDQIDSDFVFGDTGLREGLKVLGSGMEGIVSTRKRLNELGIGPPECRAHADGYKISRRLMVWEVGAEGLHMEKVVEVVGQDGSYVRAGSHVDELPSQVVFWSFRPPH